MHQITEASDRNASHALASPTHSPREPQTLAELAAKPQPESISSIRRKVRTLVSIAQSYGSSLPAEALWLALPSGAFGSAERLIDFLSHDPVLARELTASQGDVVRKGSEDLVDRRHERVELADQRVRMAQAFSDRLTTLCPWLRLVAISGSPHYGPASE